MRSAKAATPRPYRKKQRALSEAETRQRIVEAAVELHETIGPANTTIKAIAESAGVQRATVYNHFPDLEALFAACNAHYYGRHPMPDPSSWLSVASPVERFRVAVRDLYTWYEETERMLAVGIRDIDAVPPAARQAFFGYFRHVARSLMTDAASEVVHACARRQPSVTRSRFRPGSRSSATDHSRAKRLPFSWRRWPGRQRHDGVV